MLNILQGVVALGVTTETTSVFVSGKEATVNPKILVTYIIKIMLLNRRVSVVAC